MRRRDIWSNGFGRSVGCYRIVDVAVRLELTPMLVVLKEVVICQGLEGKEIVVLRLRPTWDGCTPVSFAWVIRC